MRKKVSVEIENKILAEKREQSATSATAREIIGLAFHVLDASEALCVSHSYPQGAALVKRIGKTFGTMLKKHGFEKQLKAVRKSNAKGK